MKIEPLNIFKLKFLIVECFESEDDKIGKILFKRRRIKGSDIE